MFDYSIKMDDNLISYLLNITDKETVDIIKTLYTILLEKGVNEVGEKIDEINTIDDIDKDPSAVLDEIISILKDGILRYSRRLGIILDKEKVAMMSINKLLDYLVTIANISEIGLAEALIIDTVLQGETDFDTFTDILFIINPNVDIRIINSIVEDVYKKFFDVLRNAVNDIIKANDELIADESTTIEGLANFIEEYEKNKIPKCSAYMNLLINPDLIYVFINTPKTTIDKYIDELKLIMKINADDNDALDLVQSIILIAMLGKLDIDETLTKLKDFVNEDIINKGIEFSQTVRSKIGDAMDNIREKYILRTEDE